MKEIKLTQGKVAIVSDEDFEWLNQYKWYALKHDKNWYAQRNSPRIENRQIKIRMHREILNAEKGILADHINGNGLDNRRENLRPCTPQENTFNREHSINNKLKIKGIRWNEKRKKFVAQICINGKQIHLGSFNVLGDADSAYRKAEEKYFKEFARKY